MNLLQIVPMLPPSISGVGDYALLLARELAASHRVQTRFLNGNPDWRGSAESMAPFPAAAVSKRNARALLEGLKNASSCQAILLHYVGYGYARRGCPFWLARALEVWKRRTRGRLIVLFHEVSGSGPIWTSGFWTSGVQDWLAKRLAQLADRSIVTTEIAAQRLRAMLPADAAATVGTLAVFSTLGEPIAALAYGQRQPQMVVFGSANWRQEAYTRYLPELKEACARLRIERVVDIGAPVSSRPDLSVPFVEAGVLAASEASTLMSQSRAGFFTYPIAHIGKSTIFAAYCAHGMTPVTIAANLLDGDENLRPNSHFLAGVASPAADEATLAAVASAAQLWYQQHRLEIHACRMFDALAARDESGLASPIFP